MKLDMTQLPQLFAEAKIPPAIIAKLDTNPHLVPRVFEALAEIDFDTIEGNRAFAFLTVADRSSSVRTYSDQLVAYYLGAIRKLQDVKTVGILFAGCIAISDLSEGGDVIMPLKPIRSIKTDQFDFDPDGITPMYDTMVVALVAMRVLVVLAKRSTIKLTAMTYLIGDGYDQGSTIFNASDTSLMINNLTNNGAAPHRVSAVGVGMSLRESFVEMGINPDAIRDDITAADLELVLNEISGTVEALSTGANAGGF